MEGYVKMSDILTTDCDVEGGTEEGRGDFGGDVDSRVESDLGIEAEPRRGRAEAESQPQSWQR